MHLRPLGAAGVAQHCFSGLPGRGGGRAVDGLVRLTVGELPVQDASGAS
ncbi:hypothetical protein GO001_08935 [Streptomyces sp. NRRL B-1677]|nr:hypothetical protein [Streptomyces sp. NRRL B-1677]MBF6045342.1 hypothetical protein [Streptomyces sp. NRRL B-1677]